MKQQEFKDLFTKFKPTRRAFTTAEWDTVLVKWAAFETEILTGLPISKWLKNTTGYLPDFLDTKEQLFGHARIGNYDQVMIYQYTGTDKKRFNKYSDMYKSKTIHYDNITDVEQDYIDNIQSILKSIVSATDLNSVYNVEKDSKYEKFVCKQILRKISILMSLKPTCSYKNEFMWIYNDKSLNKLAKIFETTVDSNKTFLENNKDIYDIAKTYAGITAASTRDEIIHLYDFLWFLGDDSDDTDELTNFKSTNLIFNGAPGTGKTYGVTKGIEKIQNIDNLRYKESKYIQFHPAFSYQDFIEGIKPVNITGSGVDLKVMNGCFKEFCIFVKKENEDYYKSLPVKPDETKPKDFEDWPHYYFIVDEINRGNLSNIFGETFTLLEQSYRDYDFSSTYTKKKVNLVSTALSNLISKVGDTDLAYKNIKGEVYFGIPFNIHFIGMMNDVDKSIDPFDLALRRRFKWIQKKCDYSIIHDKLCDEGYPTDQVDDYIANCQALNNYICDMETEGLKLGSQYEIGHAFFLKIVNISGRPIINETKRTEIFNNYILETLKEYIRQVANENEIDNLVKKAKLAFGAK